MNQKASDAFKTISEVSALLDVPPHVLRFWETKFTALRPLKRSGGRRYYRPDDVALLQRIRSLLYEDGFTIKGAQKLVRSKSSVVEPDAPVQTGGTPSGQMQDALRILGEVRDRLAAVRRQIEA
jgi:DNA-binding transcriptional MerR regulator